MKIPYFKKRLLTDDGLITVQTAWHAFAPHGHNGYSSCRKTWFVTLLPDNTVKGLPKACDSFENLSDQQREALTGSRFTDTLVELTRHLASQFKQALNVDLMKEGSISAALEIWGFPMARFSRGNRIGPEWGEDSMLILPPHGRKLYFHEDSTSGHSITPILFPDQWKEGEFMLKPYAAPTHEPDGPIGSATHVIPYEVGHTIGWQEWDRDKVMEANKNSQLRQNPEHYKAFALLNEHGVRPMNPPSQAEAYQGYYRYFNPSQNTYQEDLDLVPRVILTSHLNGVGALLPYDV